MDLCALFGASQAPQTQKKSVAAAPKKKKKAKPSKPPSIAHSRFVPKPCVSPEPAPPPGVPENADVDEDADVVEDAWEDAFVIEEFDNDELEEVRDDTSDGESENFDTTSLATSDLAMSPDMDSPLTLFRRSKNVPKPVVSGPCLTFDDDSDIV